jgi:DNA-binding transcriptional ArsR family regulator
METANQFSEVASLLGEKSRSLLLWHLLEGRPCTPTELSHFANISAQSASNHLSKLVEAHILSVEYQGRHRYYRFASDEVAHVVESMASLVTIQPAKKITLIDARGITYARTCYDHLAGKLAVDMTASLVGNGIIKLSTKQYEITKDGKNWLQSLGIKIDELRSQKRSLARPCLDWSERKHHLAGALGAVFLQHFLKNDWIRRTRNSREVIVTASGKRELERKLGIKSINLFHYCYTKT